MGMLDEAVMAAAAAAGRVDEYSAGAPPRGLGFGIAERSARGLPPGAKQGPQAVARAFGPRRVAGACPAAAYPGRFFFEKWSAE